MKHTSLRTDAFGVDRRKCQTAECMYELFKEACEGSPQERRELLAAVDWNLEDPPAWAKLCTAGEVQLTLRRWLNVRAILPHSLAHMYCLEHPGHIIKISMRERILVRTRTGNLIEDRKWQGEM